MAVKTATFRVTISFREELVGDESNSDSFYLRVVPKVTMREQANGEPLAKQVAKEILEDIRKKRQERRAKK